MKTFNTLFKFIKTDLEVEFLQKKKTIQKFDEECNEKLNKKLMERNEELLRMKLQ